MYRVTDYSFLFQSMFGKNNMMNKNNIFGSIRVSDLSSKSVKKQLVSAGIDINSKQYKAVAISMISANGSGGLYTNIQAIKNRMSQYDSDGNYTAGGLIVPEFQIKHVRICLTTQSVSLYKNTALQTVTQQSVLTFSEDTSLAKKLKTDLKAHGRWGSMKKCTIEPLWKP